MTARARIGLQLQPQHADYGCIRDTLLAAEEAGADVVFNWDHFFPLYGDPDGSTSSVGPCSGPGRRPRPASRSARS